MEKNFVFNDAEGVQPVIFETIFAEKNGGGLIENQSADVAIGTALGKDSNGKWTPLRTFVVYENAASSATSIKIEKGSTITASTVIGVGSKAVAATALSQTASDYDTVTVSLGVAVKAGQILYEAAAASESAAAPKYTPVYLCGTYVPAGVGALEIRLINGANIRKETAPVADEVVALMPLITKI